ncbi:MAG: iron complex outermembrane receptor protein [Halieaceae bacterium]|jgi:iron complex outermembrane receptor protein
MEKTKTKPKTFSLNTPRIALGFAIASAGVPGLAMAQGSSGGNDNRLEEVVVTALKRTESLQDVPVTVTAFNQQLLDELQIFNVLDFNFKLPNVSISPAQASQNSANIFIRGIGQDLSTTLTESAVGVYVDGVFFSRQIGGLMDLVDIERIEILRGPQGTLYGRNNIGGAVKIETRRPDTEEISYLADVTTGSFSRLDMRGAVNLPISDNVAARLSAVTRSNTGYYTNAETGRELNRKDSDSVLGKLLWNINEDATLILSADYSRDRSGIQIGTPFTTDDVATAEPVYGGFFKAAPVLEDLNAFDGWGVSATLEWNLAGGILTSITAWREIDYVQAYDLSGTPFVSPPNRPFPTQKLTRDFEQQQFTQEIQFVSDWEGPLNLTAGVFYLDEDGWENLGFVLGPDFSLPFISNQISESLAGYVEATYDVTSQLSLTAGIRYTEDDKDIDRDGIFAGISATDANDDITPRFIVNYQPSDDFTVFASYSEGYQAGEFQPFPSSPATAAAATLPQNVTAYEVGAKSEWLDNRLRANLALFRNDYEDLAVGIVGDGNLVEQTSADTRVQGVELELSAQVAEGFSVSGFISYLDSEYTRAPGGELNPRVGEPVKNAPEFSGRLTANYDFPVSDNYRVGVGASYVYTDDYFALVPNLPWYQIDSRGLLDARLTLSRPGANWQLELAGQNLTDERYALQTTLLSGPMRYYMPERTWSLTFRIGER